MPQRDAWWSIGLYHARASQPAVDRLHDWALQLSPDTKLEKKVIKLASITLTWMLTSSNRFLRDRATRALVSLLTGRFEALLSILERFANVDDLYVVERLYAVAYGVAMRSHDAEGVGDVAQWVYDKVFAKGNPPTHILLRNHARGVVERALYPEAKINVDKDLIKPPYKSECLKIPTEEEIKELTADWKPTSDDTEDIEISRNEIRESIEQEFPVFDEMRTPWLSLKLDEELWVSGKIKMKELLSHLGETVRDAWEVCEDLYDTKKWSSNRYDHWGTEEMADELAEVEKKLKKAIKEFRDKLPGAHLTKVNVILSQIESGEYGNPPYLKPAGIKRYMLKRVFDLGWTLERFGEFDSKMYDLYMGHYSSMASNKADRIGEKYRRIAYHEIVACLSDRFQLLNGLDRAEKYEGPWQLSIRDIDPSVTLLSDRLFYRSKRTAGEAKSLSMLAHEESLEGRLMADESHVNCGKAHKLSWWAKEMYTAWKENEPCDAWLKCKDDLPKMENLLKVTDNSDKCERWLNLYSSLRWEQPCPDPYGISESDLEHRLLSIEFRGYLVRNEENAVKNFMDEFYADERRMLKSPRISSAFLGEYGWVPTSKSKYEWVDDLPETPNERSKGFHISALKHLYDSKDFDNYMDTSFGKENMSPLSDLFPHFDLIPHFDMIKNLKLRWTRRNAEFEDDKGKLAAYDPTADDEGPIALLFREDLMRRYLDENELFLCWLVHVEKRVTASKPLYLRELYVYENGNPQRK